MSSNMSALKLLLLAGLSVSSNKMQFCSERNQLQNLCILKLELVNDGWQKFKFPSEVTGNWKITRS